MHDQTAGDIRTEIYNEDRVSSCQDFGIWSGGNNPNKFLSLFSKDAVGSTKMTNRQNILSWVIIILLSIPLIIGAYWAFWPIDILNIKKVSFIGNKNRFKQGEAVGIDLQFDKFRSGIATVNRSMTKLDNPLKGLTVTIIAATKAGTLPVGVDQHALIEFIVPVTTPPGLYNLHVTGVYQINPLRTFTEEWYTPEFEVVAR